MTKPSPLNWFKASPEIIRLAVMLNVRFPLALRNVEDLLHERGVDVSQHAPRWEPRTLEALFPLLLRHGTPEYIRSDSGPEFAAEAMQDWLRRVGIMPIRIYPGSPWENGYNERFNGTLRREVLNAEWFTTTKQAQVVIDHWLRQYNQTRPHQALDMRPPVPETLLEKPLTSGPERGG